MGRGAGWRGVEKGGDGDGRTGGRRETNRYGQQYRQKKKMRKGADGERLNRYGQTGKDTQQSKCPDRYGKQSCIVCSDKRLKQDRHPERAQAAGVGSHRLASL